MMSVWIATNDMLVTVSVSSLQLVPTTALSQLTHDTACSYQYTEAADQTKDDSSCLQYWTSTHWAP